MAKRNFVPAKGARLLRRVAKHILAEPKRYNQNAVIVLEADNGGEFQSKRVEEYPRCGTVACIGGWIQVLTAKRKITASTAQLSFRAIGRKLGVPAHPNVSSLCDYVRSYSSTEWPYQFATAYRSAKTPRQRAKIAAARIEHFIKTGE